MSGSVRSNTTAVLHRGHRYATDAPQTAQEPIPMAGGRFGGLRDEVPGGDVEWDVGGGEEDLEEFGITPPRGVRREAAERSRRCRDEEAYIEGVRREHLGSA